MRLTTKFLSLFLLLNFFSQAFGANYSYLIGGGGESGADTIFDLEINSFSYINKFTDNQKIYFDGGHPLLEKNITSNFPKVKNNYFREADYLNFLADLKENISSGKIKEGDQVLVSLFSHGAEKEDGVTSHKIALKKDEQNQSINLQNLSGTDIVSLDDLKEIIKLAEEKGVKLGIIDQSCYGGATTILAKNLKNVCILSGTNDLIPNVALKTSEANPEFQKELGMTKSSIDAFSDALNKPNTNLEEVYLSALENTRTLVSPMSSLETMGEIEDQLNSLFSTKLDLFKTVMKMVKYEEEDFIGICHEKRDFDSALAILKKQIETGLLTNTKEFQKLAEAVEKYKIHREKLAKAGENARKISEFMSAKGIIDITIPIEEADKTATILITKRDLIDNPNAMYEKIYNMFQDKSLNKKYKKALKEKVNILKEQRKILLVEYEKIPKNDDKKMSELTNDLFKASLNVMVQMNQLKREIYLSKVSKETSNPCRDFKIN